MFFLVQSTRMQLCRSILLCLVLGFPAAVSSSPSFVERVAGQFHDEWKANYRREHPHVRNRFKLTSNGDKYRAEDFVYPMILTVGPTLVHRNLKVARHRTNSSLIFVDILNLSYDDLPDDWAKENRATAEVAVEQLFLHHRRNAIFDAELIETISAEIHRRWAKRNEHRSDATLLKPYRELSELEKEKDRRAIRIALQLFNRFFSFRDRRGFAAVSL